MISRRGRPELGYFWQYDECCGKCTKHLKRRFGGSQNASRDSELALAYLEVLGEVTLFYGTV